MSNISFLVNQRKNVCPRRGVIKKPTESARTPRSKTLSGKLLFLKLLIIFFIPPMVPLFPQISNILFKFPKLKRVKGSVTFDMGTVTPSFRVVVFCYPFLREWREWKGMKGMEGMGTATIVFHFVKE